jgi:riboflavin-specific deaminase-like protein
MEMMVGPMSGALDATALAQAYPWPAGRPWLRSMMLMTLDGAVAGPDGLSGSISAPADRLVLSEVRRLADAVLIGAGTLRAERYRPLRAKPADLVERSGLSLADAPVVVVVSASLDLPWEEPFFAESSVTPIVITVASVEPGRLRAARERADVIVLEGQAANATEVIAALHARGLMRIVCEGGPRLLAGLTAAGLVDEADLTIAPRLAGGGQVRAGDTIAHLAGLDLAHLIVDDGFLFTRYLVNRGDTR